MEQNSLLLSLVMYSEIVDAAPTVEKYKYK